MTDEELQIELNDIRRDIQFLKEKCAEIRSAFKVRITDQKLYVAAKMSRDLLYNNGYGNDEGHPVFRALSAALDECVIDLDNLKLDIKNAGPGELDRINKRLQAEAVEDLEEGDG